MTEEIKSSEVLAEDEQREEFVKSILHKVARLFNDNEISPAEGLTICMNLINTISYKSANRVAFYGGLIEMMIDHVKDTEKDLEDED